MKWHSHRRAPQKNSLISVSELDTCIVAAHFFDALLEDASFAVAIASTTPLPEPQSEQDDLLNGYAQGVRTPVQGIACYDGEVVPVIIPVPVM